MIASVPALARVVSARFTAWQGASPLAPGMSASMPTASIARSVPRPPVSAMSLDRALLVEVDGLRTQLARHVEPLGLGVDDEDPTGALVLRGPYREEAHRPRPQTVTDLPGSMPAMSPSISAWSWSTSCGRRTRLALA